MSQATKAGGRCEQCQQPILYGQQIVTLHHAVFHAECLVVWCQIQSKEKRDVQTT